ncbi:SP_1767 family glycosyltransferase [Phocaeicola faecalis]
MKKRLLNLFAPIIDLKNAIYYRSFTVKYPYEIKNTSDTIDYIVKNKVSVSRYGDGEFGVMNGSCNGFQTKNEKLGERLREVIESPINGHILCIPYALTSLAHMNKRSARWWRYFLKHHKEWITSVTPINQQYFDASFTRFYIDLRDKKASSNYIERIKRIWYNRDVYIIEGAFTRLGINNDLLDGASSVHRILCPSRDAYSKYEEILYSAKNNIPKGKNVLILLALGMTATVLAYDLHKEGFQAIDIGHIDVEYCWLNMGAKEKCYIEGKAVNEVNSSDFCTDLDNKEYTNSIIDRII